MADKTGGYRIPWEGSNSTRCDSTRRPVIGSPWVGTRKLLGTGRCGWMCAIAPCANGILPNPLKAVFRFPGAFSLFLSHSYISLTPMQWVHSGGESERSLMRGLQCSRYDVTMLRRTNQGREYMVSSSLIGPS